MPSIVCSYIGVHQMFQLALAAQEMGALQHLYCSMVDLPGKWGALLARLHRTAAMLPVGVTSIEETKITEIPLPLLSRRLHGWLYGNKPSDYFESNEWFDRSVARRLANHSGGIFVGAETCAQHSLAMARRLGMTCVLDCPGIPSQFLAEQVAQAAEELRITVPTASLSSRMLERKAAELDLADAILLCSEFQRDCFVQQGIDGAKLHVNPLWADSVFFLEAAIDYTATPTRTAGPLRALFVGGGSVAKGAP
ncbi:MAG: hypothetical protein ACOYMN_19400, partial [Roseimicrobium sp.]